MAGRDRKVEQPRLANLNPAQMKAGIARLEKIIAEVEAIEPRQVTDQYNAPHLDALEAAIDDALTRTYGPGTVEYNRYISAKDIDRGPYNYAYRVAPHEFQASIARSKATSAALLKQAVKSLGDQLAEHHEPVAAHDTDIAQHPRRCFIVHGHDDGTREAVARFLERIKFEAIILHERPNKGRTIITKFREEAADVGFAIVLMTPDDIGGKPAVLMGELKPRARQNVVFELGFFIGALGPDRVAALVKGNIERPSDFDGVVYIPVDDNNGWKQQLAKELEAADYEIDWNFVMRA